MTIQIAEIKPTPEPLVSGKKVKATCKVTANAGIESVKVSDPRYLLLPMYDDGTHGMKWPETASTLWPKRCLMMLTREGTTPLL